jgi:hypothetical protein
MTTEEFKHKFDAEMAKTSDFELISWFMERGCKFEILPLDGLETWEIGQIMGGN